MARGESWRGIAKSPSDFDPDAPLVPIMWEASHRCRRVRNQTSPHARLPALRARVATGRRANGGGRILARIQGHRGVLIMLRRLLTRWRQWRAWRRTLCCCGNCHMGRAYCRLPRIRKKSKTAPAISKMETDASDDLSAIGVQNNGAPETCLRCHVRPPHRGWCTWCRVCLDNPANPFSDWHADDRRWINEMHRRAVLARTAP
jgi:hypothetical protein